MTDFNEAKTKLILNELLRERKRQHKKFGQQDHDFPVFLAILQEEIGEASKAWLHANLEKVEHKQILEEELRNELVQIAAVAVQMLEAHDREDDYSFLDCKQPGCCNCPGMERCNSCGYTEHDKRHLMDHHLCDERRTVKRLRIN